jgi:enterochelin esterase-like enzyme
MVAMHVAAALAAALVLLARPAAPADVVGDLRLHSLTSKTFGNTRTLRVLLPAGYDEDRNRSRLYPVLFLNDGQNLFDPATAALNPMEWRVDETLRDLTRSGAVPPLVVVGIDSAGRRGRFKEYFPWVDEFLQPPEPEPQGKQYPAFLVDEVLPFVRARYRVRRDAEGMGVGGSSAGALAALYAVIARPGTFGRLLLESPSLYVDDFHVVRDAARVRSWPSRIYLGVGTNEQGAPGCRPDDPAEPELVRDVRRLERALRDAGVAAERIRVLVQACATHDEAAWSSRLPEALRFLFGRRPSAPRR